MQNFPPHTPISSPQHPFCPLSPFCLLHLLRKQGCPQGNNKPRLFSVAIKVRAEQTCLLCRTAATKRSEAHLKGDLEGLNIWVAARVTNRELNLPRIATQSILGLNRRRLGIVNIFPLHSTCTIFLCYTEQ